MLSTDLKSFLTPMVRTMTIIWGAMMAASVIYVFIAWIMFGQAGQAVADAEAGMPGPIAPVLGVVAFLVVLASIFVERWWFSGSRIMEFLDKAEGAGPASTGMTTSIGGVVKIDWEATKNLSDDERKLAGLSGFYQTGMIIIWAMREAVAVLGLVGAIVTSDFMVVVPFGVGALAFLAIKMPRPVAFLEQVRRLPGAFS